MKKKLLYLFALPLFVGGLFACGESKTDAKILDGKWNIVELRGEKVEATNQPNMEFNMSDLKLHGNAGCNIFNTSVVLDDANVSALRINQAATTMMACPDMEVEGKILKALDEVRAVKAGANENEVVLTAEDGSTVFLLVKE
ncbi:MAG TPA: META domain-containing protein [Candidatus Parabacteroides intestinipullorum]|uniref:META domain-containing protein n=1 Tax=Candidatus Parabacteroides intestinipullorum TaxID=2838723 RepID=A0A9D1X6Y1_9BACT|nr:META domain-containing protein [Candidatus Parabacteroides intestinipullorum]